MSLKRIIIKLKEKMFQKKFKDAKIGTQEWLVKTEITYGGKVVNVKRNKVGSGDHRSSEELKTGGMTGGDRMSDLHHGYGKHYSHYLMPFVDRADKVILAEVGILKGSGLAIWSDLFPSGRIIGLDIDLSHTKNNMQNLKSLGAFQNDNLELNEFDQFEDNRSMLKSVLKEDKIDIFIDDGLHSEESILSTLKSVQPNLAENFVYIIEDSDCIYEVLKEKYQDDYCIASFDQLTVLCPK